MKKTTQKPIYYQIKERLTKLISSGAIKAGQSIPSECELAQRHFVSRMTARRAVTELVKEGLLIRISGKGAFVSAPGDSARRAADNKSIAFCIYDFDYIAGAPTMELADGINAQLTRFGYSLKIGITKSKFKRLDSGSYYKSLKRHVSGLIIHDNFINDKDILDLKKEGVQFALINRSLPGNASNTVMLDYERCAERIVDRLIKSGHRKIGLCVGDIKATPGLAALAGYKTALEKSRILFDKLMVIEHGSLGAYLAAEKWIEANNMPTAILGSNDLVAIEIVQFLNNMGFSAPEDVTVVSMNGYLGNICLGRNIVRVRVPYYELGKTAAALLLRSIENPEKPAETLVISLDSATDEAIGELRAIKPGLTKHSEMS
jgi:DNA-binding LacI/PurR family transcriptional regulator